MISVNKKIEKVLFLGPKGSYSDAAKTNFSEYYTENCQFLEVESIYKIVDILLKSDSNVLGAVLPLENSVEGIVRETQDKLTSLAKHQFKILAESKIPVEHSLIGYTTDKSKIKIIKTHPQAIAQCREFLFRTFNDNIITEPTLSTSAGVSALNPDTPYIAAIGSEFCAKIYKIPVIDSKINDEQNNTTRFILLSKLKPNKDKNNKISIMFSTENKPGALNKTLHVLEKYNINLSYIDSRPSKKELGEYVFYADFAGYIDDNNVSLALIELQSSVKTLSILSDGAILY